MPRIRLLPPETSRLIAAGEVIDRPASVLREFLDNALDAGAREILVEIEGGGADLVRVADDGEGMGEEDLGLSILPHATSKIRAADDLLTAKSLGFRGEALASIAAAAQLELTSKDASSPAGHRLSVGPDHQARIEAVPGRQGTVAQASRLFDNYPARKQFLKRSQAEASACKQIFLDKAAAHPEVAFRYSSEGRLALALKPARPEERIQALYPELPPGLVYALRFSGAHCEGQVVIGSPGFYRNDRRLMQVFVNRRRVQDPGLLQALDYAFSGFLPGGCHPAAFLFAEVDPAWADFNIHPAKKEVRFKDSASLRTAFVQAIKAFLLDLSKKAPAQLRPAFGLDLPLEEAPAQASRPEARYAPQDRGAWEDFGALRERVEAGRPRQPSSIAAPPPQDDLRFLGKALGLFLVVEARGSLYLIDQHAAHERVLYDELMAGKPRIQDLLVPAVYEPEDAAEAQRLEDAAAELGELGFGLEREGSSWMVTSLPSPLDKDPVGAVREILDSLAGNQAEAPQGTGHAQREQIRGARSAALATAACRAAVKDGDDLDDGASLELARKALALPEPRCPHGRPIWVELSREELFRLVRRLV